MLPGERHAACIWDMTKLFDFVDVTILVEAAWDIDFSSAILTLSLEHRPNQFCAILRIEGASIQLFAVLKLGWGQFINFRF